MIIMQNHYTRFGFIFSCVGMTGMLVLFMILCASIDFTQCLSKDEQSRPFIPSRAEEFSHI